MNLSRKEARINMRVRRFLLFFVLSVLLLGSCFVLFRTLLPSTAAGPTVQAWLTTSNGSSQLTAQPDLQFGSNSGNAATITVDDSHTLQQMVGFGAAVTDSSAWLIHCG